MLLISYQWLGNSVTLPIIYNESILQSQKVVGPDSVCVATYWLLSVQNLSTQSGRSIWIYLLVLRFPPLIAIIDRTSYYHSLWQLYQYYCFSVSFMNYHFLIYSFIHSIIVRMLFSSYMKIQFIAEDLSSFILSQVKINDNSISAFLIPKYTSMIKSIRLWNSMNVDRIWPL